MTLMDLKRWWRISVHTNVSLVQSLQILLLLEWIALECGNLEPTSVSRIEVGVKPLTAILDTKSTGWDRVGQS